MKIALIPIIAKTLPEPASKRSSVLYNIYKRNRYPTYYSVPETHSQGFPEAGSGENLVL